MFKKEITLIQNMLTKQKSIHLISSIFFRIPTNIKILSRNLNSENLFKKFKIYVYINKYDILKFVDIILQIE